MRTVITYKLDIDGRDISLPIGAEIIKAFFDGENLYISAMVQTLVEFEVRYIECFYEGSGMAESTKRKYIDSCIDTYGRRWYVFEALNQKGD